MKDESERIHILVADDHPIYRAGLRTSIEAIPNMLWIGEAATGKQAVNQAIDLQPDIILMDIQMPGMNGIDATREILRLAPRIQVIILTMHEDNDSLFAAMRAGARGYVLKGADQDEITRALHTSVRGESPFSPAIAQRLLDYFSHPAPEIPAQIFPQITAREREVLELVAQGLSNDEIAERLSLSNKTVRNHVSSTYLKLQVSDRAQAIVLARKSGLGN